MTHLPIFNQPISTVKTEGKINMAITDAEASSACLAINVVSLFSGCGGMDLGFAQAGFRILWANDIDQKACETYAKNLGKHVVCGDIQEIDYSRIPNADLILGGFPCQDFSMIWKRGGITTERGNLYRNFVNLVSKTEPLMFIAENVKGLMTANQGKAIKQIIEDFSATGRYGYETKPHLVNFADYGTPQLRKRVLIIGIRKDINLDFEIPKPTHQWENAKRGDLARQSVARVPRVEGTVEGGGHMRLKPLSHEPSLQDYVSSSQALAGVEKVAHNNEHQNIKRSTVEKLKLIPAGGNFTDIPKDSPHYVKGMISHVYRRLDPDKPSTTIIAAGGGGTWGYHYSEPRPLTNRERARLFGYPDDFVFEGTITEVRRQIGNSVPPVGILPFAQAIKPYLEKVKISSLLVATQC
jgi:DNA (cytosine-5)-methyltransferase 1